MNELTAHIEKEVTKSMLCANGIVLGGRIEKWVNAKLERWRKVLKCKGFKISRIEIIYQFQLQWRCATWIEKSGSPDPTRPSQIKLGNPWFKSRSDSNWSDRLDQFPRWLDKSLWDLANSPGTQSGRREKKNRRERGGEIGVETQHQQLLIVIATPCHQRTTIVVPSPSLSLSLSLSLYPQQLQLFFQTVAVMADKGHFFTFYPFYLLFTSTKASYKTAS